MFWNSDLHVAHMAAALKRSSVLTLVVVELQKSQSSVCTFCSISLGNYSPDLHADVDIGGQQTIYNEVFFSKHFYVTK